MYKAFSSTPSSTINLLLAIFSAGLLAVWPLPETIALRHIFIFAGFMLSIAYFWHRPSIIYGCTAWPLWLFFSFYGWLLIHFFCYSTEYQMQLMEAGSIWFRSLLVIPLGLSLGLALSTQGGIDNTKSSIKYENWMLGILLLGLSSLGSISIIRYVYETFLTLNPTPGDILFFIYKAKQPFVVANALLLPLCFILILRALNNQKNKIWIVPATIGMLLSLFGSYFSNTKNGIAIFAIVFTIFLINLLLGVKFSLRRLIIGIFILAFLGSASYFGISKHLERNPQWFSMIADAKIGIDIDHQNRWKNSSVYPVPLNELGRPVDISTYERSAWFTAGSRLLIENPLGYGLVNHSFGALASAKWPDYKVASEKFRGATHSGWLDFALGLGIPGLLLVLIPLWTSWYRSLYQNGLWFSYASWTIPIMSFAYLTTEVAVGHFIEMLFFMTAFFCGLTLQFPVKHLRPDSK